MDEPKRFTIRWRDGMYRVSDPTLPDEVHAYRADDPAIVQALAIRKACADAGLLDDNGNLRKIVGTLPITADGAIIGLVSNCYAIHEGELLECGPIGIRDDDDGCGVIVTLRDVSGFEHEREPQQIFAASKAAERAAKGGTDGH